MKLHLNNLDDTNTFASALAHVLSDQVITITLDGDLGAGKTAWTRLFGQALGVKRTINSPTFTIMKSYNLPNGENLYHFDAYRLEGAHQDLGFEEYFDSSLCVVEWANYIEEQIPADHISISIERSGETSREVEVGSTGNKSKAIVGALESALPKELIA